ncbi:MAG: radical SAM protein, partial [Candidatus Woesearchaeota archaeon]
MRCVIIDGYTDEPSGLGVPPYLGTYPRYLFGLLTLQGHQVFYLTIDDLRARFGKSPQPLEKERKTSIKTYNRTVNSPETKALLEQADMIVVVAG